MQTSKRYLCFRGDGFIEAGGRFAFGTVPDKIEFDKPNMAEEIIDVIETGMKESRIKKISDEQFRKEQIQEMKELENLSSETTPTETVSENEPVKEQPKEEPVKEEESTSLEDKILNKEDEVNVEKNKELLIQIQSRFKTCTAEQKAEIKKLLKDNNINKFDINALETAVFEKALSLLQ